jgi:hypothetical protein
MSNMHNFAQWLWRRPLIGKLNWRIPVPLVVSRLFFYILVMVVGYKGLKPFVPVPQQEAFEAFWHNAWILLTLGIFFCALTINDYLDKEFPSAKTGFFAKFSPGKRDYKDPLVRLNLFLGVFCLIAFGVGLFQTWASRIPPVAP